MPGHTPWRMIRDQRLAQPGAHEALDRRVQALTFGLLLHDARTRAGISQSELARRMGTNQAAIARLELGSGDPKLSTIHRAAQALGCTVQIQFEAFQIDAEQHS